MQADSSPFLQVLIQLLTVLAVVRKHSGEEWIKQKLEGLGAKRVFLMQDNVREILEDRVGKSRN